MLTLRILITVVHSFADVNLGRKIDDDFSEKKV